MSNRTGSSLLILSWLVGWPYFAWLDNTIGTQKGVLSDVR